MLGHTHALFGITTLAVVQALSAGRLIQEHVIYGVPAGVALCAGAAIFGALLPDLDADDSTIQRELGSLGLLARLGLQLLAVKHRGVLHSGLATVIVTVLAVGLGWYGGYPDVGLALGLGYASHVILADAMTRSGVPLWWPARQKFHVLPKGLRIRTGGPIEYLLFGLVALFLFTLIPVLLPPDLFKFILHSVF